MNLELDIKTTDTLLNAILFCLRSYLEDSGISERPWLFELAESYNELVHQLPCDWNLNYGILEF